MLDLLQDSIVLYFMDDLRYSQYNLEFMWFLFLVLSFKLNLMRVPWKILANLRKFVNLVIVFRYSKWYPWFHILVYIVLNLQPPTTVVIIRVILPFWLTLVLVVIIFSEGNSLKCQGRFPECVFRVYCVYQVCATVLFLSPPSKFSKAYSCLVQSFI